MDMEKKDVVAFFQEMRAYFGKDLASKAEILTEVEKIFADTKIKKLDIKRMYRYLDKNTKREGMAKSGEEADQEDDYDNEDDGDDML